MQTVEDYGVVWYDQIFVFVWIAFCVELHIFVLLGLARKQTLVSSGSQKVTVAKVCFASA